MLFAARHMLCFYVHQQLNRAMVTEKSALWNRILEGTLDLKNTAEIQAPSMRILR